MHRHKCIESHRDMFVASIVVSRDMFHTIARSNKPKKPATTAKNPVIYHEIGKSNFHDAKVIMRLHSNVLLDMIDNMV